MRHILSVLMENESGALSRVSGLFSARAYNIESLNVAPTNDPSISRLTLVTYGSAEVVEQIKKQLGKLIDVVKILDLTANDHVEREILLLKLKKAPVSKKYVTSLVEQYNGRIVDDTNGIYTLEITGTGEKLDQAIVSVESDMIFEVVRSGALGIACGDAVLSL